MTIRKILLILMLLSISITPLFSYDTPDERQQLAENLLVKLVVIGAADPLYSWWGHIAFIIENLETGGSRYYDYGNFSFDQDSFLLNFVMGRMYYLKMASNPERQLKYNASLNRDVTVYTLNVVPEERLELLELLENDIRPENRVYLYNLFLDNCSTRIRDRMDVITDGAFSMKYKVSSDKTLRIHLRRFLYSNKFMDGLLNFALGPMADRPATEWDGMYLPDEMGRAVELMMVHDEDGNLIPLVKDKDVYNRAIGRPAVADYPPPNWHHGLIIGVILAVAAWFLTRESSAKMLHRSGFAVYSMLLSFFLAVPGLLLFFMACFTEHNYTFWNINLLFVNPFLFFTFALSLQLLIKRGLSVKAVRRCWAVTATGAVISLIIKIIPFFNQNNWETFLIVLPPALILSNIPAFLTKHKPTLM
ncbi:MAG: DUF4105 domain-containing protein [Spirochaetales bacterium]|uniref:DUF4105 domain-containing protein n=1 Tax=Candidatus Thalassospirochaeta sargassi TaxID=3119039 RepID=A0AAJ1IHL2_9SPIO|nr:DUF4105 domain-containing protein [Spirochaetales bacterium]